MKKIITSKNAPSPIGPYNQAVIANGFMYISGQVGMNPKTGKIIKDSISDETNLSFFSYKMSFLRKIFCQICPYLTTRT